MNKLLSRKLWMALAGIGGNVLLVVGGLLDVNTAIQNISMVILVYLGAQGIADIGKK